MVKMLTREEILGVQDIATEVLEVPEWGGTVKVRGLTGAERDRYENDSLDQKGKNMKVNLTNARARLVALSLVDDDGKLLFTEQDVRALGRKSAAALDRIFSVAQRLSGLTQEDMDELTKNSDEGQNDGSGAN